MLKIKSLSLKNFKSIGSNTQTIEFAPITLLFGPNGAGKSTIIQALAFLNEIINHRNYDPIKTEIGGDAMDLGGFLNLVHKRDKNKSIEIGIGFDLNGSEVNDLFIPLVPIEYQKNSSTEVDYWIDVISYPEWLNQIKNIELQFKISWNDETSNVFVEEYKVLFNETLFYKANSDDKLTEMKHIDLKHKSINHIFYNSLLNKVKNTEISIHKQSDAMPSIKRKIIFDIEWRKEDELDSDDPTVSYYDEVFEEDFQIKKTMFTDFLDTLIKGPLILLSQLLNELTYIGPLRELPSREIKPQQTYDRSQWSKGLEAWNVLYKSETTIVEEVNKWMNKEHIYTGYEVNTEHSLIIPKNEFKKLGLMTNIKKLKKRIKTLEDNLPITTKLSLKDLNNDISVMLQDIGVGISQLLPIIVLSCHNNDSEKVTQLVAIEQPELHIHPALQVELADLFISSSMNKNKIFLIETHSEHLILRLLRRIRESVEKSESSKNIVELKSNGINVIYVEPSNTGSYYKQIRISKNGEFMDRWPRGFFEERYEELF